MDKTLGSVRRNLQVALIVGGVATWRIFDLNLMQLLGVVILFLFIGTVDQVAILLFSPKRPLSLHFKVFCVILRRPSISLANFVKSISTQGPFVGPELHYCRIFLVLRSNDFSTGTPF